MDVRDGEDVLYEGRPSWRALLAFYIYGLVGAAVASVIVALVATVLVGVPVGVGIVALTLVIGYLRRLSTKYLVTSRRLRITRGILRRKVQETRLERVQNVNYEQSVINRMLRVGSVDFDTAGSDDSDFRFEWVNGPEQVVRAVDEAIAEGEQSQAERPRPDAGL